MRCPFCGFEQTQVRDSRPTEDNAAIRRRRFCSSCQARFTTVERTQLVPLTVRKRNGETEPFERDKLERSMSLSLRKRPIEKEQLERIINSIVRQLESLGESEISSVAIGEMAMEALSNLDLVAYIRFASIYKDFSNPADFQEFVGKLKSQTATDLSEDGKSTRKPGARKKDKDSDPSSSQEKLL